MFEPGYTEKVVNYCSGVAYTYRDVAHAPSELTAFDGPAIGDRAPDVDFEQGGALFDRLRHDYFTLLAMPDGGNPVSAIEPVDTRLGAVVKAEILPKSEALSKRYGTSDGRLFLVRPDGYIAFKCKIEEAGLLEAYLGRVLA
jgi:hypothetical protein